MKDGRLELDNNRSERSIKPFVEGKSSFNLKDFELSVLDRGETVELVGKYEGMPFSQLCQVAKREESKLEASFRLSMDLRNLPYQAKVGAVASIILEKPPGLQPRLTINVEGTYQRNSKKYGNGFNTYRITGKGNMYGRELPAFVAAAIGKKTGLVGNVPGPGSPVQAAAGMLFPPLAALLAHVIQELLRPKPEKQPKLSAFEQAMADANKSLGKGLYDEKEAKALARKRNMGRPAMQKRQTGARCSRAKKKSWKPNGTSGLKTSKNPGSPRILTTQGPKSCTASTRSI